MWLAHAFALGLRSETLADSCEQNTETSTLAGFATDFHCMTTVSEISEGSVTVKASHFTTQEVRHL